MTFEAHKEVLFFGHLCNNPRVRLKILCIKETTLEPKLIIT